MSVVNLDGRDELWAVRVLKNITGADAPIRHTSWHSSEQHASMYAAWSNRKGDEVLDITKWRKVGHIDPNTRETEGS